VNLLERRRAEHEKYEVAYATNSDYRMGMTRYKNAKDDLSEVPTRGSYLDVSCGRGEMLDVAQRLGFEPCVGTEVVQSLLGPRVVYGEVHAIPFDDKSFDVVTMFDVIEHLIPGDDKAACLEMARVSRRHILLTANNESSKSMPGVELHINRRPYDEWNRLFREWFPGRVTWITKHRVAFSETWRVDLD
jgi:ubiquinone/menaquinone biosynthesis C-methylase UbiE